MKALKVLYRDSEDNLWSALPTRCRLPYDEEGTTYPKKDSKLMVYLRRDTANARQLCADAATWYRTEEQRTGQLEVWEVECHNLYRMFYIVHAGDLEGPGVMEDFWRKVQKGLLGADDCNRAQRGIGMASYVETRDSIWSTDWLRLIERLGTYEFRGYTAYWTGVWAS